MAMLKVFLLCALMAAGSALSCRWMEGAHRHRLLGDSISELKAMANNSISIDHLNLENVDDFPNDLYTNASEALVKGRVRFVVQLLEEIISLFEEDQTSASWHKNTVDNFVDFVTQMKNGLRSCISSRSPPSKNAELSQYFERLRAHLKLMGQSAEAWEWLRQEVMIHLQRSDRLLITSA